MKSIGRNAASAPPSAARAAHIPLASIPARAHARVQPLPHYSPEPPHDAGVYMLLIRVRHTAQIRLSRHAWTILPGWYVYVGSAQRGLRARLARHARRNKRVHWHIDYLLALGQLVSARILPNAPRSMEADLARAWARVPGARLIQQFGATDSSAPSHLIYFSRCTAVIHHHLWRTAHPWPLHQA